jgi:hypothetical protein
MLGRTIKRSTTTGIIPLFAMIAVVVAFWAFVPHAAFAQSAAVEAQQGLALVGEEAGFATTDLRVAIARIIRAFFGLLGIIAVALMMYAGYLWMTAAGDASKIEDAKKIITRAVIGLFIILTAYGIVAFILRAILGEDQPGGGIGSTSALAQLYGSGSGSSNLGAGIIEYHYPESGQLDVPRNTKIAITFKKPFLPSTVIAGYDDQGTYDLADDTIGGVAAVPGTAYPLNTANIKIAENAGLGTPTGGSDDDAFDQRYPDAALVTPAPSVTLTPVAGEFDPEEGQTLVITFQEPIGSPTSDVNYRVALRGGRNGIRVWSEDRVTGEPFAENAFDELNPDGSYFWPFATGTTLDITPPQISGTVPFALANPSADRMDRNQLLQVYFDEAVDPTTASGLTGSLADGGRGFTFLDVQARCISGLACDARFATEFTAVVGEWKLSNRYRTAEFIPTALCEGVATNSCGEPVYCLPRNVDLRVVLRASYLGDQPPAAFVPPDGIVDMVGNSLDGNENGTAEGPVSDRYGLWYSLNIPPTSLDGVSDTALWSAQVGDTIDLIPPRVVDLAPKSIGSPPPPSESDAFEAPDQGGPSLVPTDFEPMFTWDKTISVGSLRTGGFDVFENGFMDDRSTVVLRTSECIRNDGADCGPGAACACTNLPTPQFFTDVALADRGGEQVSVLRIKHRPFLTGNDLGYTQEEIAAHPERTPKYEPIIRAKVKDTKQNCFFPSAGFDCAATPNSPSCCNREAQGTFNCPL